jgi:hypothetical protein
LNGKPAPWQIPDVTRQKKIPGTEILVFSSLSGNAYESQRLLKPEWGSDPLNVTCFI